MKDVAYLLATLDQLRLTTEILGVASKEINHDTWIKYRERSINQSKWLTEAWHHFNAGTLATSLNYDWSEVKPRVSAYIKILNLPVTLIDDIDYCCYLSLKQEIEDSIRYAEIIGDKVKYRRGGVTNTIPVDKELNLVLGAEGILDGLSVIDYAGSHYTTVSPAKREHLTTASTCSCREFSHNRRCSHVKLVSLLPKHRRLLQEYSVLQTKF